MQKHHYWPFLAIFSRVFLSFGNASIFPSVVTATLPWDGHVQSKFDDFVQVGGSMGLWLGLSVVQAMMLLARVVPTCSQTLMARLWLNFRRYCETIIFDLSVPKPSILWCTIDDDFKENHFPGCCTPSLKTLGDYIIIANLGCNNHKLHILIGFLSDKRCCRLWF